jgi:hypothetical protein
LILLSIAVMLGLAASALCRRDRENGAGVARCGVERRANEGCRFRHLDDWSTQMVRWMGAVGLVCSGLIMGCGDGGGNTPKAKPTPKAESTPKAAFEKMKAAMLGRDFGAVWAMLSKGQKEKMAKNFVPMRKGLRDLAKAPEAARKEAAKQIGKQFGMTLDELLAADDRTLFVKSGEVAAKTDPKAMDEAAKAEYVGTETEGDKAKVKFKSDGKERTMRFVKEDGVWKVDDSPN